MNFHIQFTISRLEKLKRGPIIIKSTSNRNKYSKLDYYLQNSDIDITKQQYLNICFRSVIILFVAVFFIISTFVLLFKLKAAIMLSLLISFVFAGFVFFSQINYPKVYFNRKQKGLERNLMPALEDMLVQLSSGVPLFNIMVNLSVSDYGEMSTEFKKAVRKINAGIPQIEVLEEMGEKNSSSYFKRTIWQISNGMKSGSDISEVIKSSLKLLNEEQVIQIQNYGNKLNPLIMFYMLITIIIPALAVTFMTIISSMIGLDKYVTMMMYAGLFIFTIFIQIMFLGAIRSSRPTLLT